MRCRAPAGILAYNDLAESINTRGKQVSKQAELLGFLFFDWGFFLVLRDFPGFSN